MYLYEDILLLCFTSSLRIYIPLYFLNCFFVFQFVKLYNKFGLYFLEVSLSTTHEFYSVWTIGEILYPCLISMLIMHTQLILQHFIVSR